MAVIPEFPRGGLSPADLAELMCLLPNHDVAAYRTTEDKLFAVIDGETDWAWSIYRAAGAQYTAANAKSQDIATARSLMQLVVALTGQVARARFQD